MHYTRVCIGRNERIHSWTRYALHETQTIPRPHWYVKEHRAIAESRARWRGPCLRDLTTIHIGCPGDYSEAVTAARLRGKRGRDRS
jgi:hypothetical protein